MGEQLASPISQRDPGQAVFEEILERAPFPADALLPQAAPRCHYLGLEHALFRADNPISEMQERKGEFVVFGEHFRAVHLGDAARKSPADPSFDYIAQAPTEKTAAVPVSTKTCPLSRRTSRA